MATTANSAATSTTTTTTAPASSPPPSPRLMTHAAPTPLYAQASLCHESELQLKHLEQGMCGNQSFTVLTTVLESGLVRWCGYFFHKIRGTVKNIIQMFPPHRNSSYRQKSRLEFVSFMLPPCEVLHALISGGTLLSVIPDVVTVWKKIEKPYKIR